MTAFTLIFSCLELILEKSLNWIVEEGIIIFSFVTIIFSIKIFLSSLIAKILILGVNIGLKELFLMIPENLTVSC